MSTQKSIIRLFLFGILCISSSSQSLSQPVNPGDSLALVMLFDSTDGTNWIDNSEWLNGPVSSWKGITVADGRVTMIRLDDNGLNGRLPAGLDALDQLLTLSVERNDLFGPIPPDLGNITTLKSLSLYANDFVGTIPDELQNLTSLSNFRLGNNQLTGPIPTWLGTMTSLSGIDFGNNQLTGPIPVEIAQLAALRTLYLFGNRLEGTIPPELGNLTNLVAFELVRNNLSGEIPASLGNLENLRFLSLYNNNLTGPIPPEFGHLANLESLGLFGNNLEGEIPSELGNLTKLTRIWLYQNQLTGSVPATFANLTNLIDLSLHENDLENLPDLSNLSSLATVRLQGNRFKFADLEPYTGIQTFEYAPQSEIGAEENRILAEGDSLHLEYSFESTYNVYQWYKDDAPISGEIGSTLLVESVGASDSGTYQLRITNVQLPDLTLETARINIQVTQTSVANEAEVPDAGPWQLEGNWPNPFKASTSIRYTVPSETDVRLVVYDLLGREIEELAAGRHRAGTYTATFDASEVPPGVYIYTLTASNYTEGQKMIVNR